MVKGIERFREYFRDFTDQYVLIGGAACDISFESNNADFRATRDLDVVLIVEALTREFGQRFWEFIRDGGYQNRAKSSGATHQGYNGRFLKNPVFMRLPGILFPFFVCPSCLSPRGSAYPRMPLDAVNSSNGAA